MYDGPRHWNLWELELRWEMVDDLQWQLAWELASRARKRGRGMSPSLIASIIFAWLFTLGLASRLAWVHGNRSKHCLRCEEAAQFAMEQQLRAVDNPAAKYYRQLISGAGEPAGIEQENPERKSS